MYVLQESSKYGAGTLTLMQYTSEIDSLLK